MIMPGRTDKARERYDEIILSALRTNEEKGLTWTELRSHVRRRIIGKATLASRLKRMVAIGSVLHEGRRYRLDAAYRNPYLRQLRKQHYYDLFANIKTALEVYRPSNDPKQCVEDALNGTLESYVTLLRNLTKQQSPVVAKEIFDFWLRNEAGFFLSLTAAYLWYSRGKVSLKGIEKLHASLRSKK
jgi:hypothetical protein